MTATILNAEKLLAKLRRMPEAARVEIRQAMADQADEIVGMMQRLAPAHIKPSIAWRWGTRAPRGSMAVASVTGSAAAAGLTLTVFAAEWTAAWFEFGTADRFHRNGKSVGRIQARPFFFVSYRANRKNARNKVRAALRRSARKVAASG